VSRLLFGEAEEGPDPSFVDDLDEDDVVKVKEEALRLRAWVDAVVAAIKQRGQTVDAEGESSGDDALQVARGRSSGPRRPLPGAPRKMAERGSNLQGLVVAHVVAPGGEHGLPWPARRPKAKGRRCSLVMRGAS
jgi:hypothetical protein